MRRTGKFIGMFVVTMILILTFGIPAFAGWFDNSAKVVTGTTTLEEMTFTENNHAKMVQATPPPILDKSLERENLKNRLLRFNNANKISYIYLISKGKVMAFFPIRGKVSSVNSKLTTPQQTMKAPFYRTGNGSANITTVVESPALDGSYGTNGEAIFFFTADTNAYIEWHGDYLLADQLISLHTEPDLVYLTVEEIKQLK